MAHGRYDLTEFEWNVIKPLLPNKARGVPTQSRRTLYQQAQAVQAHRNTIRQVRFSLPRLCKAWCYPALAQVL